jgi:flagellin-like hook-associated protein FlgL
MTFNGAEILGCGLGDNGYNIFNFKPVDNVPYNFAITVNGVTDNITVDYDSTTVPPTLNTVMGSLGALITVSNNSNGELSIRATNSKHDIDVVNTDSAPDFDIKPMGGYPNNIIQLTLDAANSVRKGTDDLTALYADLVFEAQSFVSLSIAKIGSEQAFIEFNLERLTNNMLSLKDQQNFLEHPDLGSEMTNYKILEAIYNATLQMSAATIPMSIFNYMK